MKRKITSAIAAILVGSMIIGTTVFAADSSTTTNTESSTITEEAVPAPLTQEAKEGKTMFATPNAKGVGTATVGTTKLTVNYNQCTLPGAIETGVVAPANSGATQALESYVAANFTGKKIVSRAWLRLYKAGVSVKDGFGTLTESFGVGNAYDGQTATVVQHHADGTITTTEVPVVNGKVTVSVTDLGTFFILL